ncbi:MAG: 50S ribosomal protein L24 [Solirubrobacterales bacterium]|nr:50S ribosomal protein L24 [Solirubrobacterales bacterium]
MSLRIRRDDEVVVISGKDKGRTGRVLRVDPVADRLVVGGVNIVKRHQRARPGSTQAGGVVESEGFVHVSNVALVDPRDGKPTRVRTEERDGQRVRVAVRSGEVV